MENLNQDELSKAIEEGFVHEFIFTDGGLRSAISPGKSYLLKDTQIKPKHCAVNNHIVYRITASDGIRGVAINIPVDHQDDF
jgi:hypothetical protein